MWLEVFKHIGEASHFLLHCHFVALGFLQQLPHLILHLVYLWKNTSGGHTTFNKQAVNA